MVIFTVISAYSQNPPIKEGRHKIAGGPIYELLSIQWMLEDESKLIAWTGKCRKDVMKLLQCYWWCPATYHDKEFGTWHKQISAPFVAQGK